MLMQTIKIVFENCDSMAIECEKISFHITQVNGDGSSHVDGLKIVIPKANNGVHYPFGGNDETTKFNRLMKHNDISSLYVDDEQYIPEWYYESDYCCPESNEYQHTYKTENGDLVIEISSANKQRQSDNERIVELITDYMQEYPTMTFGQVIHKIECKIGSSVTDAMNGTVITMLEELLMEAI
ncbi:MAG: hypothetical protein ACRDD7_17910 [Peptostreptococcaceae bacterium]